MAEIILIPSDFSISPSPGMVDAEPNTQSYGANEHTSKDQIKQEDSLHIDNNDLLHRYF